MRKKEKRYFFAIPIPSSHTKNQKNLMCGSLEKRGDGERQRDRETERQRPTWIQGSFGLLRSRRTKKRKRHVLTLPKTKFHAQNKKLYIRVLQTLSLTLKKF